MSWNVNSINMDAEVQDDSDKENAAPEAHEVHYPPLPLNAKGNIVMKHPYSNTSSGRDKLSTKPNTSRKRHNIGLLTETPPRASRSSQISNIFARAASSEDSVTSTDLHSPTSIPDEAMRVYKHFSQAIRTTPPKSSKQTTPKSKGKGRRKAGGKKTPHSLRKPDSKRSVPPPSPASSTADSAPAGGWERVDSGCDLRTLNAAQLAEHWPARTSAPRTESPPPVIPKPIPDPIPSPIPKPKPKARNEPDARKCQEPVYPDLSDALHDRFQYDRTRSNALGGHDRPPPPSPLHTNLQDRRNSIQWLPNHLGRQTNGPLTSDQISTESCHDIDRLTLINRKLARPDISSPQSHNQPISFLAEPERPATAFELAIAKSFSSNTPDPAERRKTLNIKIPNHQSPAVIRLASTPAPSGSPKRSQCQSNPSQAQDDDDDSSSTDSWTDDEIFFPRTTVPAPLPPPPPPQQRARPPLTRAETESSTMWPNRRLPPLPPMGLNSVATNTPMRALHSSRFQRAQEPRGQKITEFRLGHDYTRSSRCREAPPGCGRMASGAVEARQAGVPLSMEEHPSSAGSDADGEDNSESGSGSEK